LTLWTGSQPVRLDMGSGLIRRFVPIEWIPTRAEMKVVEEHRRRGRNISLIPEKAMNIKTAIEGIYDKVQEIKHVSFSSQFDAKLQTYGLIHYENELLERIGLGYTIMSGQFDREVFVRMDPALEAILNQVVEWRNSVKQDSELNQVVYTLRDAGGEMTIPQMLFALANFSVDTKTGMRLIYDAHTSGRITKDGHKLLLGWGRKGKDAASKAWS